MGNYITKADILDQLPGEILRQLTDDENLGAVNDARVTAAIEDAEGEVDGYLAGRYSTPLSPAPPAVKKFTADIAIYNLYSRGDSMPPEREKRYENAVRYLLNVSRGLVSLGAETPAPSVSGVDFTGNSRDFTRKKLEDF